MAADLVSVLQAERTGRLRAVESLRRSEENFDQLVAAVKDYAIFLLDPQGHVLTWNAGAERIKGYMAEEIIGQHFSRFYPEEVVRTGHPQNELKVARSTGRFEEEGWRLRKDGSRFWANVVITALFDPDGRLRGFMKITRDLTERKRAEEELRQAHDELEERVRERTAELSRANAALQAEIEERRRAEQTIHFLSDAGADYTCVARFDGKEVILESASEGFTPTTGYTVEEFNTGIGPFAVHPEDFSTVLRTLDRLLSGQPDCNEVRMFTRAGEVRWLRYVARPAWDEAEPGVLRILGSAEDITERKQAGQRLQESERRFRQLAENIQEVFWMSDPLKTQILYCSPAYEKIWGRSCESLYKEPWTLLGSVHPEDRGLVLASLETQSKGEPTDVEYRIIRPDGAVRWVRDRSFPIKEPSGVVSRVAGIADDITDRKWSEEALRESEERFRFLAETIPSIVWTAAPDGTITYANRRWLDYCGLSAQQNARGWPELVLHPDDYERCVNQWAEALREGKEYEIEVRNRRHDGVYRWFITRAVPLRDPQGRVTSWFGVTTDIHDRKEMEERLREADRRKDEFLATLAHELRNPLAPIRNALQVMRMTQGNGRVMEQFQEMMERQVRHMVRLVDDLLELSRITRGKITLRQERVCLATVVSNAVETSRPLIESASHELTVTPPAAPVHVMADPIRLAQVIANLLNNAAKYTEPGGRIWLGAERRGDQAVVSVRDTGVGIPAEMLPRIFELFTQVDGSLGRSQGGLGIGLTLVRRLVEMHGGTVAAHSDGPGRGSEFTVRLPVAVESAGTPDAAAGGNRTVAHPRPRCRILVADDNRDSAQSLGTLLRFQGHDVQTVHDGLQAVQAATTFRPDVVVLDIGMPKMDGYEVVRHLRSQPWGGSMVFIALTGWGQESDKRRSREAGFDHHLTKPVDLEALERLLASIAAGEPS